jgi:hypothetical protein
LPYISRRAHRELQERWKNHVHVVDKDTIKTSFVIRLLLGWEDPRWFYGPGACFAMTPHGGLVVQRNSKEPALGWSVSLADWPAILSFPDGREAVFERQKDAQISALLHEKDFGGGVSVGDNMGWM